MSLFTEYTNTESTTENESPKISKKALERRIERRLKVDGQFVNIKGSGNWSDNPRIENYDIINSKDSFEFNKKTLLDFIAVDKKKGKGKDSLNFY